MSLEQEVLYEVERNVATVTLNRPAKLNAITARMFAELRLAMQRAQEDEAVRVILLTGSGRAFCAGADMNLLQDIQAAGDDAAIAAPPPFDVRGRSDFYLQHSYFPVVAKPIICALNGAAVGIGFTYALYCDLRFASSEASLVTAFAKRGAVAEHGTSWLLPRLVGMANAFDLLYSARKVSAEEALRMGLVNRVVPAVDLMQVTRDYAHALAHESSPRSLRIMKRQIWDSLFLTLGEDLSRAQVHMEESYLSEDFREGIAHFLEKREPRFTGR